MKDLRTVNTPEIIFNESQTKLNLEFEDKQWQDPQYLSVFDAHIGEEHFCITACRTLIRNFLFNEEWDHIIIRPNSTTESTPSYEAMSKIASAFFDKFEYSMQVIPRVENYVNVEPFTLHLWNFKSLCDFQFDEVYEYINTLDLSFSNGVAVCSSTDSCNNQYMAIISETNWPCWEDIVKLKEKNLGCDSDVIIINRGFQKDVDMFGDRKIILLWDATQIELPHPKLV